VMKAFEQALCAARANGGIIDEGNHIYLSQAGINGAVAQYHVTQFLKAEIEMLEGGQEPSYQGVTNFLKLMADRYAGQAAARVKERGMDLMTEFAALSKGDERLLQSKPESGGEK
jgi:hypothetical protein